MKSPRGTNESTQYKKVSAKGLMLDPATRKHSHAMRYIWMVHVRDCMRKGIRYLGIDAYIAMSQDWCVHCGRGPCNLTKLKNITNEYYNGVDRIDNAIGYEPGNVQTLCKECNSFKSNRTEAEFLDHVGRIYAWHQEFHDHLGPNPVVEAALLAERTEAIPVGTYDTDPIPRWRAGSARRRPVRAQVPAAEETPIAKLTPLMDRLRARYDATH